MKKTGEFSDCVEELVSVWLRWLKNNGVAHDVNISYSMRRKAAETCELLIKRRHELIDLMNSYFEEK